MSRGLGQVERDVLEFIREHRHAPEVDDVVAVEQVWMVRQLSEKWQKPAIRRAVITLVAKGLLYKFDGDHGVLVDIEPITHRLEVSLSGNYYYRETVKPRRVLPDFRPLVADRLKNGPRSRAALVWDILCNTEGCWRILKGRYDRRRRYPEESTRTAFERALDR